MRFLFAIFLSFCICVSIFFGMHLMTSSQSNKLQKRTQTKHLVYLRDKTDTKIKKKKRVKPKTPPKKKPVKKIKIIKTNLNPKIDKQVKIKPFQTVVKNIDISPISSLSGAKIEISPSYFDANHLRTLKRVNPKYPRRAKVRKQEGYVELAFDIDTKGSVSNVRVLDSNPKGAFDENSIKAIKRWRFKHHEIIRYATIKFNFRLAK